MTTNQISNTPEASIQYKNRANFGKLSDLYQARIRKCDKEGNAIDGEQVVAVGIDGDIELGSQYSSPFENSNPEQKLPTLMGQLQSGDWVNTLDSITSNVFGIQLSGDQKESLNKLEGRSNLTKVNSTQIFVSSQQVQIPMTLCFSAWEDAKIEVEEQVSLLQQWSLPEQLEEGSIVSSFAEGQSLESLFPSLAPPFVSLYYGGKKYLPLLIMSVSTPIVVPMDPEGNRMALMVPITLGSRTAWDAANIRNIY